MQTFAWITGNRELGNYDHRDVRAFKGGLMKLPTTFRFGTLTKGAMSRPFAQVMSDLPLCAPNQRRNNKTISRDLSIISPVAKHLEQTAWKPKVAGAKVMDFSGATVAIKESDSTDLRPPWTTAHLECLFNSPIYLGGGAGKRRLKETDFGAQVWHDTAYFAPLIWYYTHACREEICGLRWRTSRPIILSPILIFAVTLRVGEQNGSRNGRPRSGQCTFTARARSRAVPCIGRRTRGRARQIRASTAPHSGRFRLLRTVFDDANEWQKAIRVCGRSPMPA